MTIFFCALLLEVTPQHNINHWSKGCLDATCWMSIFEENGNFHYNVRNCVSSNGKRPWKWKKPPNHRNVASFDVPLLVKRSRPLWHALKRARVRIAQLFLITPIGCRLFTAEEAKVFCRSTWSLISGKFFPQKFCPVVTNVLWIWRLRFTSIYK